LALPSSSTPTAAKPERSGPHDPHQYSSNSLPSSKLFTLSANHAAE
jgi:hypothetical protein